MRPLLPLICLLLLSSTHAADPVIEVREVLIREVERQAPAVLHADPIERALAAGRFTPPAPGQPDPDGVTWQLLTADSDGWIRDDRLARAYAHATIDVAAEGTYVLDAMGYQAVLVNGEPRVGNIYGYTDQWEPWQPAFDWSRVPVHLHAGANHLLFSGSRFGKRLILDTTLAQADPVARTGASGTAETALHPSGYARMEDKRINVVTRGEYVAAGTPVVVIAQEGARVVVRASGGSNEI